VTLNQRVQGSSSCAQHPPNTLEKSVSRAPQSRSATTATTSGHIRSLKRCQQDEKSIVLTIPQATLPAAPTLLDRAPDVRPKLGAPGLPLIPRRAVKRSAFAPQSHADHQTRVPCLEPARHYSPLCLVESQSLYPEQAGTKRADFARSHRVPPRAANRDRQPLGK